jgi:hypothetical protein
MTNQRTWTVEVLKDPDDPEGAILQLPDELLETVGWGEGDVLTWTDQKDGTWALTKSPK